MDKVIVFTRPIGGGLSVVYPAPKARINGETDEQFLERVAAHSIPKGVSYKVVSRQEIPQDRDFRDAWADTDNGVQVAMEKARDIHMSRIREARNKKLAELDIETMRGRDVQTEKQRLRDIPQTFDLSAAKTPEELKELWPNGL